MELKDYLETLSKEDLISLLKGLSDANPSVKNYLSEKQNAFLKKRSLIVREKMMMALAQDIIVVRQKQER